MDGISLFSETKEPVPAPEAEMSFVSETPMEDIQLDADKSVTSTEDSFLSNISGGIISEEAILDTEPTPMQDMVSIAEPVLQIQEAVETEDITDADSTIKKAIAELVANASKIQSKVDAALLEESRLLEEKSVQEAAHKIAIDALEKAAESARKTAADIKKSGERTAELQKLLEAQLA